MESYKSEGSRVNGSQCKEPQPKPIGGYIQMVSQNEEKGKNLIQKISLYDITADYMRLMEIMADDDADPDALREAFEQMEGTFEDKADNYARVLRQFDSEEDSITAEIKRLQERKAALERSKERLKHSLMVAMLYTGKIKFQTALFSFGIQKNPPAVQIAEDARVPKRFLIPQEPKVDKKAILEEMKSGKKFKWASLTQGERLAIR